MFSRAHVDGIGNGHLDLLDCVFGFRAARPVRGITVRVPGRKIIELILRTCSLLVEYRWSGHVAYRLCMLTLGQCVSVWCVAPGRRPSRALLGVCGSGTYVGPRAAGFGGTVLVHKHRGKPGHTASVPVSVAVLCLSRLSPGVFEPVPVRLCDPCARVRPYVPCVSRVCPGSPRCLCTGRTAGRYASAARAFISPTAFEQARGGARGAGGGRVGFAGGGLF